MGGSDGGIIVHHLAQTPQLPPQDQATLLAIADRSATGCSFRDAVTVVRIVWRLIRQP